MTHQSSETLKTLKISSLHELTHNILPFWMNRMPDSVNGGFYGRIDGKDNIITDAPKGAILNARILWTFSAAYRALGGTEYLNTASRAMDYICSHFFDMEYKGTYWVLKSDGIPLDTKKQIYSQAFFIYALSEYYMASSDKQALTLATDLFNLIEEHSFDHKLNGYLEAFDRQWGEIADLRLSEKDANEKKTMNTHLHILEAYTNLYRIWPDPRLKEQLRNMVIIFLEKIIDSASRHLNLFFEENWRCKSSIISYGHDIEASWLLYEAAEVLEDKELTKRVAYVAIDVVKAATEGLQSDGSLMYERDASTGHADMDRHWWVQSEAVVGFINAWQLSSDEKFLDLASRSYEYILKHLVDRKNGEWHWSVKADGTINFVDDKAGFWKCPYHNSRMCLEIITRANDRHQ